MAFRQECYLRIAKLARDASYPGMILSRSNSRYEVGRNVPGEETPWGSQAELAATRGQQRDHQQSELEMAQAAPVRWVHS